MSRLGEAPPPPALAPVRPFYWSLRRELWENRSILVAPLAVAVLVLFASLAGQLDLAATMEQLAGLTPDQRHRQLVRPFSLGPAAIMLGAFLVGAFHALDALYGERRDRSILFWKSLPVSDRTTVLAKAAVPLGVLPLYAFLLSLAVFAALLLGSSALLLVRGASPAPLWNELHLVQQPLGMLYGLAVYSAWLAPIYGWLLLVSAWARRLPLLWAAFPPLAMAAIEHLASGGGSSFFPDLLRYRITGAMDLAFTVERQAAHPGIVDRLEQLEPLRFLASPGLWTGLAFAASCLVLAARLRRHREKL